MRFKQLNYSAQSIFQIGNVLKLAITPIEVITEDEQLTLVSNLSQQRFLSSDKKLAKS